MGDATVSVDLAPLTHELAEEFRMLYGAPGPFQRKAADFVAENVRPLLALVWAEGLHAGHDNALRFDNPYRSVPLSVQDTP